MSPHRNQLTRLFTMESTLQDTIVTSKCAYEAKLVATLQIIDLNYNHHIFPLKYTYKLYLPIDVHGSSQDSANC